MTALLVLLVACVIGLPMLVITLVATIAVHRRPPDPVEAQQPRLLPSAPLWRNHD